MSASHYCSKKLELSPYSQAQPGPVCNSHPKGTSPSSPTAAPSCSPYCQLSHLHLHLWPLLAIRRGRGRQGKPPTPLLAPFLETAPESHLTTSTSLLLTPSPLHTPRVRQEAGPSLRALDCQCSCVLAAGWGLLARCAPLGRRVFHACAVTTPAPGRFLHVPEDRVNSAVPPHNAAPPAAGGERPGGW